MKLKSLIRSRRFWVAVAGLLIVVSDELGLGLTNEQVIGGTCVAAGWILCDSLRKTE